MASPSKALLCLHGTGSSANIFRLQLAKFRLALNDFEFVFMDAPYPAPAGPGVLPMFAAAAPFHGWFSGQDATIDGRLDTINDAIRVTVEKWETSKKNPKAQIVGVLAFSEGALVASMLLWQQQIGLLPWLPTLYFATLICCFFPDEAAVRMLADSKARGNEKALIEVPTLHIHGRQDFCLTRAQKLVAEHYRPDSADVMEFSGGHQVPNRREDCAEATKRIMKLFQKTIVDCPSN
ncbi:serine hydrolase FSH [Xylariaceae sp. FL1651]|nr:serine hydrolase FSH [Xylariaceae sp. FL1651]